MKILVTGAAGFIGYHLCSKLLEIGEEVIGFDNINDYYDQNLKYKRIEELNKKSSKTNGSFHFFRGSLEKNSDLMEVFNFNYSSKLGFSTTKISLASEEW